MSTLALEINEKITSILELQNLDLLIISDLYNIQYSTGIKIPCSHAQPDLVMIALISQENGMRVILPEHWVASAKQTMFDEALLPYSIDKEPIEAAKLILENELRDIETVGSDDDIVPLKLSKMIEGVIGKSDTKKTLISEALSTKRATKTATEIKHIRSIALKTDHAINGYFHHLIADRSKSSMSISENLRIHSLERDIEIEGYNACSRGVIGQSIENIWAYAPAFGFASNDFTNIGDTIIADAMNNERGYWSNSARIGIMADEMSDDQEEAYDQLVRLRKITCENIKINLAADEIYHNIVRTAKSQNISIIKDHSFGFSVGVCAKEAPFLSSGDETRIEHGMTLVLDGIIDHKGLLYRSRDTVLITDNGPELLNCYKDWREPYFALNTI
jgi:Xaa-Pro aminopeptidase